jgi:chorismate synthase
LAKALLAPFGSWIGSFVVAIGHVAADLPPLSELDEAALEDLSAAAERDPVRSPDARAAARMREAIDAAKAAGDTLGGVFCVFATGVPAGLGSHGQWDRRIDGLLAQGLCSIPAVKGVEVGPAFGLAASTGLSAQDPIESSGGHLRRGANHAGGVEGGVTNGQPVVLRAAMKPLSSVRAAVETVDLVTGASADAPYVRSDVCAVPAASVVGEAMVAWTLGTALVDRFGGDRMDALLAAAEHVRRVPFRGTPAPRAAADSEEPSR